jgi:hypothetical protein
MEIRSFGFANPIYAGKTETLKIIMPRLKRRYGDRPTGIDRSVSCMDSMEVDLLLVFLPRDIPATQSFACQHNSAA